MRSKNKFIVLIIVACLCLFAVTTSAEIAIPVKPYNHVVDLAGIIDDNTEAGLNRYLLELEQKTTAQMVILTITSLEGRSIEDVSIDIAHNKWKLGQKGKDNGALLLVSLQDRKYRFEIGYGLEGVLPDSLAGSIGRQYLVPYFRKGDYSSGIAAAALAAINTIADEAGVEITGMPKMRARSPYPDDRTTGKKPTLLGGIFSILLFIGLIYLFIKHPRLLLLLFMANMLGGGRRDGWGGGGGFGGGGGSFGGGGGGGFGGGGASGGW
jgi:uncharacterized protein